METLSEEQKKKNHIESETRRRNLIRAKFDELVELVPALEPKESRSEHAVLSKTADYIEELRALVQAKQHQQHYQQPQHLAEQHR